MWVLSSGPLGFLSGPYLDSLEENVIYEERVRRRDGRETRQ